MFFFFNYMPYIAIIGDIKDSKKLNDRKKIQEKLQKVLNEVNQKYYEDISSNFMITLGDEFQGLLCNGSNILQIITEIESKMYPVKIRYGIGVGEIITDINADMAIGADGPGYHKAREAVEYLKQNEKRKQIDSADIRLGIEGDNESVTIMINTIFTLLTVIKESWSDRQREVITDMLGHQDGQVNVARRMGIQQSTVQRILAKGRYYAYKEALDTVGKVLGEITQDDI